MIFSRRFMSGKNTPAATVDGYIPATVDGYVPARVDGSSPLRREAGDLAAHLRDDGGVVGCVEDRRAGDEGVGAGGGDLGDVVGLDAAVDLEADVAAGA